MTKILLFILLTLVQSGSLADTSELAPAGGFCQQVMDGGGADNLVDDDGEVFTAPHSLISLWLPLSPCQYDALQPFLQSQSHRLQRARSPPASRS